MVYFSPTLVKFKRESDHDIFTKQLLVDRGPSITARRKDNEGE